MRKYLKVIFMSIILILVNINMSMAASGSAAVNLNVTSSSTSVNVGDTFTVTLSQECTDGIVGIDAVLEYDSNVFELAGTEYASEWSSLGTLEEGGNILTVWTPNGADVYSGNVVTLTFKALNNAENSKISIKNIVAYKDYSDTASIEEKSTTVNVGSVATDNEQNQEPVEDNTVNFKLTPIVTNVNVGGTFTVVVAQESTSGIKSIETTVQYDPNVLQLVSVEDASADWAVYGSGEDNDIAAEAKNIKTSGDVFKVSFKALQSSDEAKISLTNTKVVKPDDTLVSVADKETSVKVVSTTSSTSSSQNNSGGSSTTQTTTSATAADTTTTTASSLPRTGNRTILVVIVALVILVLGLISYRGYQKYRGI